MYIFGWLTYPFYIKKNPQITWCLYLHQDLNTKMPSSSCKSPTVLEVLVAALPVLIYTMLLHRFEQM